MRLKSLLILGFAIMLQSALFGQTEPSPFDFGKMWTFENPPKEWFQEAYNFEADDEWFMDVRKSSLRFASWCSASFVSKDGLVMTNHHCSQPVAPALQKDGEDFDTDGFYAPTQAEERKSEGLFVEQLHKVADITQMVKAAEAMAENEADVVTKRQEKLQALQAEFAEKPGWEGLRTEIVTYYSGGKFSMYGYKKYDDVRLVFLPELQLGFYGGDPDNFTYPRYNLDCTFWRVYDENGQPLNTSENYFKFNADGIKEDVPVFVIGNPGTTERYRTVSQLEYDRDYRYPTQIKFMDNRMQLLKEIYEENPNDNLQNQIFGISNSLKAVTGTQEGLENDKLFSRKVKMENKIRAATPGKDYWDKLAMHYEKLSPYTSEVTFLGPNPINGKAMTLVHQLGGFLSDIEDAPNTEDYERAKEGLVELGSQLNDPQEIRLLGMVLGELNQFASPDDEYLRVILDGRSPEAAAKEIIESTIFNNEKKIGKLMKKKPKKLVKDKDPIFEMARLMAPKYTEAVTAFQSTSAERQGLNEKISNEVFNVLGDKLPPDATFTLRISDGVAKGYEYNGTTAPIKTTYYGMYDRHYSNDGQFPWSLPDKWKNPPTDLLREPINFVCTADIIGGNSGSPVINIKKEAVGLVFDGNIESLPGKFIFDEEYNRTVAVHAGGIVAALRYIYKADRIVSELMQ